MTWREIRYLTVVLLLSCSVLALSHILVFQVGRQYERGRAAELYVNLDSAMQAYTAINGLLDALEADQRTCHDQLARFLLPGLRGGALRAR